MLASNKDGSSELFQFSLASDIVELVVLTTDETFLQTLRDAVGGSRRLWHVPSSDKVSDLLVAGQVGILVLDVQALYETPTVFVSQIKRQFPDLVVVVAGNRDAETLLAGLISLGIVYRFIHKPMSPGRARLFADAAVKRYDEQRLRTTAATLNLPRTPRRQRWLIAGGCLILLATAAALWSLQRSRSGARRVTSADEAIANPAGSELLSRAAAALAANRLVPPAPDNALDLYLVALARNPTDAAANAGLAEVHERLMTRAENALLEERLDEAAAAIQTARKSGVESGRIALLTARLTRARALLREPPVDSGLAAALSRAADRIQQGHLLEPMEDNARYYVQRASRIAPNSDAVTAVEESLAMALVIETHSAIDRRDFTRAAVLIEAARGIASPTNVEHLEKLLRAADGHDLHENDPASAASE